jgi:hypothetical protein
VIPEETIEEIKKIKGLEITQLFTGVTAGKIVMVSLRIKGGKTLDEKELRLFKEALSKINAPARTK